MEISLDKTVVLMKHTGGKASWALRKVVQKDEQGRRIPIKPSHMYLGVVIGF